MDKQASNRYSGFLSSAHGVEDMSLITGRKQKQLLKKRKRSTDPSQPPSPFHPSSSFASSSASHNRYHPHHDNDDNDENDDTNGTRMLSAVRKNPTKKGNTHTSDNDDHGGNDEENMENEYERARRDTRPEWRNDESNRLLLKLPDGTLAVPQPRPAYKRHVPSVDIHNNDKKTDTTTTTTLSSSVANHPQLDDDDDENDYASVDDSNDDSDNDDTNSASSSSSNANDIYSITSFRTLSSLPSPVIMERRNVLKSRIAEYAEKIIADPEHSISASAKDPSPSESTSAGYRSSSSTATPSRKRNILLALHQLCADGDPIIRRLAMLSLTTVFKDIVPGYRIRLPTEKEMQTKQKKDVKKLRDYEAALLKSYQRFLQLLEFIAVNGHRSSRNANRASSGIQRKNSIATAYDDETTGTFLQDSYTEYNATNDDDDNGSSKKSSAKLSKLEYSKLKMDERKSKQAMALGLVAYDADHDTIETLSLTAITCMGTLLFSLPHFNFRTNIIDFLVPRMSSKNDLVSDEACKSIQSLFINDTSFEASCEVAKAMSKMVANTIHKKYPKKQHIRSKMLLTLLHLPLTILERIDNNDLHHKKSSFKKHSKHTDNDEKAMVMDIEAGLKVADAEALDERRKLAKSTLKAVITVYFRILRTPSFAYLLPEVLQGLAKFAHFIDVSVVTDLLYSLRALLKHGIMAEDENNTFDTENNLDSLFTSSFSATTSASTGSPTQRIHISLASALNCVLTAFRIMTGPGELLNSDETEFAHFLYGTLPRLITTTNGEENALLACYCVQALFLNRREYSNERVAAFAKRLLSIAIHLPTNGSLAIVNTVRALLHRYPAIGSLLNPPSRLLGDTSLSSSSSSSSSLRIVMDESLRLAVGSKQALYDCDHAQALSSATAWELNLLNQHYHPFMQETVKAATIIAPLNPSQQPNVVYQNYNESLGIFNPPIPLPVPHILEAKVKKEEDGKNGTNDKHGKKRTRYYYVQSPHRQLSSWWKNQFAPELTSAATDTTVMKKEGIEDLAKHLYKTKQHIGQERIVNLFRTLKKNTMDTANRTGKGKK